MDDKTKQLVLELSALGVVMVVSLEKFSIKLKELTDHLRGLDQEETKNVQ